MIGMSQIKRKFYTGLGIGLGVGLVLVLGVSIWSAVTINSYQEGTNKNYIEKYTQEITVTNQSIIQGQTVTSDMLTKVRVHINMAPQDALNSIGENMVARYNIGSNMPITNDMITEEIIDNDLRETEINTVVMPTNMVEGSYVDIRIQFPNGTDYVVLPEHQVKKVLDSTMWLDLTEEERSLLNSAIVDTYLNEGTKLYAIEYVDPVTQRAAAEEKIEEIVRGNISSLIAAELPELYSATYDDTLKSEVDNMISQDSTNPGASDDNTNNEQLDWLIDEDSIGEGADKTPEQLEEERRAFYESQVSANKAEIIYNFIRKYRNLVACTTSTVQTYQPTPIVREAMVANPNITEEAKAKLNVDVRNGIDNLNRKTSEYSEEAISKIVQGATTSIEAQKAQRNSVMTVEE